MDHENLEFGCLQWKHRVLVAIPFLCMAAVATSGAKAQSLSLHQIEQLAPRCAPSVAVSTLAAIGETESRLNPLSIHDNTTGLSAVFSRRSDALEVTSKLIAVGDSVDIGLMQVDSRNFASLGLTLAAAFDPCQSMEAGATILAQDYAGGPDHAGQQAALKVALSRYNTGDPARGSPMDTSIGSKWRMPGSFLLLILLLSRNLGRHVRFRHPLTQRTGICFPQITPPPA